VTDEVRHLRVEVQVLERAVSRFEERLAGLREEVTKGFDRMDIVLANQFGEVLMLFGQVNDRIDALGTRLDDDERRADERHAELLEAIRSINR
jgi:chaperonin cofactor prefoldin